MIAAPTPEIVAPLTEVGRMIRPRPEGLHGSPSPVPSVDGGRLDSVLYLAQMVTLLAIALIAPGKVPGLMARFWPETQDDRDRPD